MIYVKQSTAVTLLVGPFLDSIDGDTPETGLTIAQADVRLSKNGGNMAQKSDTSSCVHDELGYYTCSINTSDTNTLGVLKIMIHVTGTLSVELEASVLSANVYDTLFATSNLDVNIAAISGDSVAADNLESQYDETGLSGDTFPSNQSQILNIANVGSAVNTPAESYLLTTGVQSANLYTDTKALDGIRHTHTDTLGELDLEYVFNVGSGTPSSVKTTGALIGNNDTMEVMAYDYIAASYIQIGVLEGKVSSTNEVDNYELFTSMVGTGANLGEVKIKFRNGAYTLTSATLYIDQIYVAFSGASSGYELGSIWVDDSVSNTGTVIGIDGVATNPVSTWAAALTLSAATNLNKFKIANGTEIILTGNSNNFTLIGFGWILVLGGQSIEGAHFEGASVTGTGTSVVTPPKFKECRFGTVTLPPVGCQTCGFGVDSGVLTGGSAGQYAFVDCFSMVPGQASPSFVFTGLGPTVGINNRGWKGGSSYTLDFNCTLSHELIVGGGTSVITGGADVEIRGITRSINITASAAEVIQFVGTTGAITLDGITTATFNLYGVSAGVVDNTTEGTVNDLTVTNDNVAYEVAEEILTASTHNTPTSLGRRLRDLASNIVLTGKSPNTANTANTSIRIEFDSDASSVDGSYDPSIVVITEGKGVGQARQIFEYDGANKYAYVNRDWKIIPDNTSVYIIIGHSGDTHVNEGVAIGGGNSTITLNALASSVGGTYNGQTVFLTSGVGADQARTVISYDGTNRIATLDRVWETNPVNGLTVYSILPTGDPIALAQQLALLLVDTTAIRGHVIGDWEVLNDQWIVRNESGAIIDTYNLTKAGIPDSDAPDKREHV